MGMECGYGNRVRVSSKPVAVSRDDSLVREPLW